MLTGAALMDEATRTPLVSLTSCLFRLVLELLHSDFEDEFTCQ